MDNAHSDFDDELLEQAETLKLAERYAEAIALLETLLATHPDNVAALEELADSELSLEHYERASTAAKRAVALDATSYTGHYILGFLASQDEDWPRSIRHLRQANHLKPNNPEILRCLGWSLFSGGEKVEGMVTLERALNIEPGNVLTLCDLGVAHIEAANLGKARALFERALMIDPKSLRALECLEMVQRLEKHTQDIAGTKRKGKA